MNIVHPLPDWPVGFTGHVAASMLTALARAYLPWRALNPLPPLYGGGVVYRLEPGHGSGWDEFANPWLVAERGWADCDDAVLYRLVELMFAGERAAATRADWDDPDVHVLIRRRNGKLEDPSLILIELERRNAR